MSAVGDILLAPDVRPFAVAAAIMVALGGIELLTTMVGLSISELIGKDFAVEAEKPQRSQWPVSLDQRRAASPPDPDHSDTRHILDRRIPASGTGACRRRCSAVAAPCTQVRDTSL